jgi:hypothetical protein
VLHRDHAMAPGHHQASAAQRSVGERRRPPLDTSSSAPGAQPGMAFQRERGVGELGHIGATLERLTADNCGLWRFNVAADAQGTPVSCQASKALDSLAHGMAIGAM